MTKQFLTKTRWLVTIILLLSLNIGQMRASNWTGTSTTKAPAGTYKAMVSGEVVVAGDTVIIAGGTSAMSLTQNSNNRGVTTVSVSSSTITLTNNTSVQAMDVKVSNTSGRWLLHTADGYLYAPNYTGSSSGNYLRTETTNKDGSGGDWSISYNEVKANGNNRSNMRLNGSLISCYSSGQTAITVYKKAHSVTYKANGGSTTCSDATLYKSNATVTVCATTPTQSGFTFTGWTANVDLVNASTSATITAGTLIAGGTTVKMPAKHLVFTAQWESAASCSANPSVGTASLNGAFSSTQVGVTVTGLDIDGNGGSSCTWTDGGFVWSSSVATPTLVEATGAAAANCTKVQYANGSTNSSATSFSSTLNGTFSVGATYYYRAYGKNNYASGTYQYGAVQTFTPRSITLSNSGTADGGTFSANYTQANSGMTVTLTATPTNSHYTFSSWTVTNNSTSATITVTNNQFTMPDANVTVSATFNEAAHATVTFKNNGGGGITGYTNIHYYQGDHPSAPTLTDGTDHDACDATSNKHYGWTKDTWSGPIDTEAHMTGSPGNHTVYLKGAELPAIAAGDLGTTITYNAIWAQGSGSTNTISIDGTGLQNVVKNQTSGYGSFDFSVGGYTFHVSAATKCTDSGTANKWFQLKKNNDYIQIPTLPGKITNISSSAIRTATSANVSTGVYFNSSATTSQAIASETLSSATSFSLDVTGNNTSGYLLVGAATCINQLSVTYSTASYSNFLTTCCEHIVPAPEVEGTSTKNTITLSWTNVTGANGYTVTCSGGTPGEVTSSGTSRTCEITGLSPNTAYTWTVVATYDSPYCQATAANGSTTTKQVYTVSYNKNGGTIANLPSGGSYAAGETVTVAAKPDGDVSKGGYEFTGWNTAATPSGSSTHYDADGTATFTMPASTVTLYAEWTPKKYYYVDRMHGNGDGVHTKVIGGVTYDCYVGEAQHTTPNPADNSSGTNSCVTGHSRFIGWVISTSIGAQGQLLSGYTIIAGGIQTTAGVDGRIYYAVWAEE